MLEPVPLEFNAVSAAVIEMKMSYDSVKSMEVGAAVFSDKQSGPACKIRHAGPWPKEVIQAADKLRSVIEDHLLGVYFEVGDDRSGSNRRRVRGSRKQGIVKPSVERSGDEPPQL